MKTVIWVTSTIIMMIAGITHSNNQTLSTNFNAARNMTQPFCDNEPIAMHSHVHNSGGSPISGAFVTLTLSGTSTPQYSGTTNGSGDLTFSSVAQGTYSYKVSATGYLNKTATLNLHANFDEYDTLTTN